MTDASAVTTPERLPVDFRLTLPAGWVRLPLDDRAAGVVALVAKRRSGALPVEQQEGARQALAQLLLASVEQGRRAGGLDLLLSVDPVEGVTVPAVCLVSYVEPGPDDAGSLPVEQLLEQLGGPGAQTSVVELASGPAVRRATTRVEPSDDGQVLEVAEVAYWLRVPGRPGLLALTFSTGVPELAPALTVLFDAVAETFWWAGR